MKKLKTESTEPYVYLNNSCLCLVCKDRSSKVCLGMWGFVGADKSTSRGTVFTHYRNWCRWFALINHSMYYNDMKGTSSSLSTTLCLENYIVCKRINVSAGSRCIVTVPKVLCQQVFLWWGPRFTGDSCMIIHDLVTGVQHMPPCPPAKVSPNNKLSSIWKLHWWINSSRRNAWAMTYSANN